MTSAVRALLGAGAEFTDHPYKYEEKGGTATSSRELGVDEHAVIKTLVMERDDGSPLVALMHGDRQVSTKELARIIGAKSVKPCRPEVADRHSGYQVGGTSPFGLRKKMPIYLERSALTLPRIYVNGGKRGYLVGMNPAELVRILNPVLVDVAIN